MRVFDRIRLLGLALGCGVAVGISATLPGPLHHEGGLRFNMSGQNVMMIAAAPARSGAVAEREEWEDARSRGTLEAVQLFIDRHPDSQYRGDAETFLRQLPRNDDTSSNKTR